MLSEQKIFSKSVILIQIKILSKPGIYCITFAMPTSSNELNQRDWRAWNTNVFEEKKRENKLKVNL